MSPPILFSFNSKNLGLFSHRRRDPQGGKKDDGGGAGGALLAVLKGGLSIKKPKVSLIFDAINR